MAKTWIDAGMWTPQESWRAIRNLRAAPPDNLAEVLDGARADVFHMALEQSEQLFRAAAAVERESRPVLLFYALGQAGRALAAASTALDAKHWEAGGHGLKTSLADGRPSEIWDLRTTVTPNNRDLFSRTSLTLNSDADVGEVTLGAAAANLVEFVLEFRDFHAWPRILFLDHLYMPNAEDSGPFAEFPVNADENEDPERFLASVPQLASLDYCRDDKGEPRRDHNMHVLVAVPWSELEIVDRSARLRDRQSYRGSEVAIRLMGNATTAVHPLMVWWLVLYPLSMLARYEPRKWQQVLDVRRSDSWSQIEYLCDRALDAVPQLLAEALATLNRNHG